MKLALVTPNYAPHFEGGTERVVRAQARELGALGHDVRVASGTHRAYEPPGREVSRVDGIEVVHLFASPEEHFDVELVRPRTTAACVAEVRGADLVHVHHWLGFGMDLVRELVRDEPRRPVVLTLHDLFATCVRSFRSPPAPGVACPPRGDVAPCVTCIRPDAPPERDDASLATSLAARVQAFEAEVRAAAACLAPSASHARRVEELLGLDADSVLVVPNGLCADLGASGGARSDGGGVWDGGRALAVLHHGHRAAAKGTLDLVRALAELPPGSVELHLAGTSVEPGFDEALRDAAGGLRLVFHGRYEPERLGRIARDCDLAALPSRAVESYGLVVDEALALGLPVWVSGRGALAERVGRAGRVLPAENPPAWTSAFRELLENPRDLARQRAALPTSIPTAADAARRLHELYPTLIL